MSLPSYVVRRKGSTKFYVRVPVPRDLQERLGTPGKPRRERWQSLNTSDEGRARRDAQPIIQAWLREFEDLRRPRPLTEAELQNAIWKRYVELIAADEKFRLAIPTEDDLKAIWVHIEEEFGGPDLGSLRALEAIEGEFGEEQRQRVARLAKVRADVARGEVRSVADTVQRIIEERRLELEPGSEGYKKLALAVQRAEIEALNRAGERDAGDWSGEPRDKMVRPPTVVVHPPGETILELFDRYHREAPGRVSEDGWDQNRKIVALFDQFVGGDAHISELNRKNVRDWKGELFKWPRRAADTAAFKGLSFRKVIELNATIGKPVIAQKTVNKYLSALGGFSTWLLGNGFTSESVMDAMFLQLDRSKKEVYPFDADQLKIIFRSPLFNKCGGDDHEHEKGKVEVRDWRYWLPWLAAYSGARLGELAQLLTKDVRQIHGKWCLHITEEGSDAKSTKTGGSMRVVPIHSKLLALGFDKYHSRAVALGRKQLFEIEPDARGYFSGQPSKFFGGYFRAIGVKVDKRHNFHSFRHSAADAFRRGGYDDSEFNVLLGHTKATTTGRYGNIKPGMLEQRVEMIEAIKYP